MVDASSSVPKWQRDRTEAVKLIDEALRQANVEGGATAFPDDAIALLRAAAILGEQKLKKERADAKAREQQEKADRKAAEERERLERKAAEEQRKADEEREKAVERAERKVAEEREKAEREERRQAEKRALADAAKRSAEERRAQEEAIKQAKLEAKVAADAEKKALEAERKAAAADKKAAAAAEAERAKAEREAAAKAKAMAEEAAQREAAAAAAAATAKPAEGSASADATPRKSGASAISEKRLERSSTRLSSFAWRRGSDDMGSEDKPSYSLMNIKTTAASKAFSSDKGGAHAHDAHATQGGGGPASQEAASPDEVALYLRGIEETKAAGKHKRAGSASGVWLEAWREAGGNAAGIKASEMSADVGMTGDCLTVLGDGDTLVCIGGDGNGSTVSLYSASKGAVLRHLHGHESLVCCVAAQPVGDKIASAGRDKTIRLWSSKTGECHATLEGCEDQLHGLAMRNGLLVSGEGSGKRGRVRIWSLEETTQLASFSQHGGPVWSVSMNDTVVLSGSFDGTARVWPLDSTKASTGSLAKLDHPTWVFSVSVDGQMAATGCGDRNVRLWSLSSYTCVRTFTHGSGWSQQPVFSVRLHRGVLASAGEDKVVRLWSLEAVDDAEPCIATLAHGATVRGIAVLPNGVLASAGGNQKKLIIWRAR